jgi:hypothetical protein
VDDNMSSWISLSNAAAPKHSDPYVAWARRTLWRCYQRAFHGVSPRRSKDDKSVRFVRVLARAALPTHLDRVLAEQSLFDVPPLYRKPVRQGGPLPLHFTAQVPIDQLHRLDEPQFGLRWELAVPLREDTGRVQASGMGMKGRDMDSAEMLAKPVLSVGTFAPAAVNSEQCPLGNAIAVIDYGAPFLNRRFWRDRYTPKTRIGALWDQDRRSMRDWWSKPLQAGYGRELSGVAIDEMLDQMRDAAGVPQHDETTVYRTLDYLLAFQDPRRRAFVATHGAHVLDMAGGRDDPLELHFNPSRAGQEQTDPAGEASLVFVQLPALTASDSTGASLGAQLLDAVRYVLDVCGYDARVVVNISFGNFAGAHDGSSLIERAFDELLELRRDNFAIVLAAGNARQACCHTRRTVRTGQSALLRFMLAEGDANDSFVELWYPRPEAGADAAPTLPPLLEVRARTPDGDWSAWVAVGGEAILQEPATRRCVAMLQHLRHAVGSDDQSMVLLSMAPTAPAVDDDAPLAPAGPWEIEVRIAAGCPAAEICIDAWIERDDPGDAGARAGHRFMLLDHGDQYNTLSSLACGKHTVVVGGYRIDDEMAASYSSLPAPGWRDGGLPMVLAPCEEDAQHPDIRAAAVRSADSYRMNGTSVAAPVVARRLFNHLIEQEKAGKDVARNQWPRVLRKLCKDRRGRMLMPRSDEGQGP